MAGRSNSSMSVQSHSNSSIPTSAVTETDKQNIEDVDYTKDNVPNPVDSENVIQGDRIMKILGDAINKIKLVLAFPHLYSNTEVLSSTLKRSQYNELDDIYKSFQFYYGNGHKLERCMDVKELMSSGKVDGKDRCNLKMTRLIYILKSYPELRVPVDAYIEEDDMPVNFKFLLLMEQVYEKMAQQTTQSAREIIERRFIVQRMKMSNELHKKTITELENVIKKEQEDFKNLMADKKETIKDLKRQLYFTTEGLNQKIHKRVIELDREMVAVARENDSKLQHLKESHEAAEERYNYTLERHFDEEAQKREKRDLAIERLKAWLLKYDEDMAERQDVLDEYNDKLKEQEDLVEGLENEMKVLDDEYVPLMEAREAEYVAEMTKKKDDFLKLHIARVLQYTWRLVLFNRKEKKRLRRLAAIAAAAERRNRLPTL